MNYKIMIAVLIFAVVACGAPPIPTDSGVEGQVWIGPMCPVVQVGQDCPDQPYQAILTVNNPNGREIAQVQTDEEGRFKIPLAPGGYILHPESPNVMPFASDQNFVVEAGKFTQVIVRYDSGIR